MVSDLSKKPQAAFAVIDDAEHDGRRLFLHAKNNLSAEPQGLAYRMEQRQIDVGIIASRIVWEGASVAMTTNDAMAAEATGREARTPKADAIAFLLDALASGSVDRRWHHCTGIQPYRVGWSGGAASVDHASGRDRRRRIARYRSCWFAGSRGRIGCGL